MDITIACLRFDPRIPGEERIPDERNRRFPVERRKYEWINQNERSFLFS